MEQTKKIRAKVYFNEKQFQAVALDAEKAGKRRGGLQLFTQKAHGFANERVANTDGISKFLKHCWKYYVEHEADRLAAAAELAQRRKALEEEAKRKGISGF
jgi:hypothetical protein